VRERGRLLREAPGLVEPQRVLFGHYTGRSPGRRTLALGLALYDAFGGERTRAHHDVAETLRLAPHAAARGLLGASTFLDAKTDDARLVLRVLHEAERHGARVVNDARVESLLRDGSEVVGARIAGAGFSGEVRARAVVNATGTWADGVRAELGAAPMLRPLRGSHLLFPP
jgi:glycerol-3-phosphate dehydrogenase